MVGAVLLEKSKIKVAVWGSIDFSITPSMGDTVSPFRIWLQVWFSASNLKATLTLLGSNKPF
jgi:hypothetical protein